MDEIETPETRRDLPARRSGQRCSRSSAKERLAELIEPALEGLHTALKSREIPSIVKAAQVVLDRTGFHPTHAVELYGKDGGPIEVASAVPIEAIPRWLQLLLLAILGGKDISEDLKSRILGEIEGSFDAEYNVISTADPEDSTWQSKDQV